MTDLRDEAVALAPGVNVCPDCGGCGWVVDKPWKGPMRWWMPCGSCRNAAGLPEPDHRLTPADR